MIIIGYQGIGKSTLAGKKRYIDLESGNFFIGDERSENWYIPYCTIAMSLSSQGYDVFMSSHECVRQYISSIPKQKDTSMVVVFPSPCLKDEWVRRLELRWLQTNLDKDYRAWKNAENRYLENINELQNADGFDPILIEDMNYNLDELLSEYKSAAWNDMDIECERRILSNIQVSLSKEERKRTPNWEIVQNVILRGTCHSGQASSIAECERIGCDPYGRKFDWRAENES